MIPTIKKPARVTKHTATAVDNIITNCILKSDFKSTIVKADLSYHFPIIFIYEFKRDLTPTNDMEKYVHKQDFDENVYNCFKQALFQTSRNSVKNLKQPNETYHKFIAIFNKLYDKYFPIKKIKTKPKRTLSLWITNDIAKSSKRRQKLYEKILKHRIPINKATIKLIKTCWER